MLCALNSSLCALYSVFSNVPHQTDFKRWCPWINVFSIQHQTQDLFMRAAGYHFFSHGHPSLRLYKFLLLQLWLQSYVKVILCWSHFPQELCNNYPLTWLVIIHEKSFYFVLNQLFVIKLKWDNFLGIMWISFSGIVTIASWIIESRGGLLCNFIGKLLFLRNSLEYITS